jgi:PEP-CTERM motif
VLDGKRLGLAIFAAVMVVLGSSAASADIVRVTVEGVATPFTSVTPAGGPQDFLEGDPFDVTLEVFIQMDSLLITPGPPDILSATGTVLSWIVIGDTWTESYDAATFMAGYDTQENIALLNAVYIEDPALGIVPLALYGGASVSGSTDRQDSGESALALMVALYDPSTGALLVSGGMSDTVWDASGSTETGYSFLGVVTDYTIVPEPATLGLFGLGIGAVAARGIRRRRQA